MTSLATLLEQLSEGAPLDRDRTRRIAAGLHATAAEIRMPAIERHGLVEVVATFHLDRRGRLVVTGREPETDAEVTLSWDEAHFPRLEVDLGAAPEAGPYAFAVVDFSIRGRPARVVRSLAGVPAGTLGEAIALVSLGDRLEVRLSTPGGRVAVPADSIELG